MPPTDQTEIPSDIPSCDDGTIGSDFESNKFNDRMAARIVELEEIVKQLTVISRIFCNLGSIPTYLCVSSIFLLKHICSVIFTKIS